MLVRDVSEFGLIDILSRALRGPPSCDSGLLVGIGDDAAAWRPRSGVTVFTTDTMVEGVHFDLEWMGWAALGRKSLAVNLSDIAAMGCSPSYAVVTLGLRGDLPVDGLTAMYEGLAEAARGYGCAAVGGDVVGSPVFFVGVAALGSAERPEAILTRSGASPGEVVAVTGRLGSSAAGLRLLRSGSPGCGAAAGRLKEAHLNPRPRVAEGRALAEAGVSAAIDVSDGLVADLEKLCRASGVGAELDAYSVPVDEALRSTFPDDWLDLALGGGEDYELLFTAREEVVERAAAVVDAPVTVIGRTVDRGEGVRALGPSGVPLDLRLRGWDHLGAMGRP